MTITNKGTTPDRLTCASVAVGTQCQVHTMTMEGGVMRMRPLPDGLEIKPGETIELKPSGYHLMFMGLKQPLVQGKSVTATLKFQNAGSLDVEYAIQSIGANSPPGAAAKPGMKMDAPAPGGMGGMKM
jgi:copper(I)-binding protein